MCDEVIVCNISAVFETQHIYKINTNWKHFEQLKWPSLTARLLCIHETRNTVSTEQLRKNCHQQHSPAQQHIFTTITSDISMAHMLKHNNNLFNSSISLYSGWPQNTHSLPLCLCHLLYIFNYLSLHFLWPTASSLHSFQVLHLFLQPYSKFSLADL